MRNGGRSLDIVHCIINSVSAHLAASALLAYGASPVMADAQEEMREIEEKSDALYINLGMLHEEKKEAIRIALETAHGHHPVVLDPVGVAMSAYRLEFAKEILGRVDFVRGNASEIAALVTGNRAGAIDSAKMAHEEKKRLAEDFRARYTDVALTGDVDILVTDTVREIAGGSAYFGKMTGAGCVLSALVAAELARGGDSLSALTKMKRAGEIAERRANGAGSFVVHLIDALEEIA